jgi:uncharacterized protein (TIGR03067 family)
MEFATGTGLLTTGILDLEVKAGVKAAERRRRNPIRVQATFRVTGKRFPSSKMDDKSSITPLPWGPEGSFDGTYQIDGDTEEPKSFSLHPAKGVLKGQAFLGIYRVEGDTLTLCFSWPPLDRPTEFRSRPNSTIVLAVFRRAKP